MDCNQANVYDDCRKHSAVNPIQHTAVTRHYFAHIFDSFLTLNTAFQQVSKAGDQRD